MRARHTDEADRSAVIGLVVDVDEGRDGDPAAAFGALTSSPTPEVLTSSISETPSDGDGMSAIPASRASASRSQMSGGEAPSAIAPAFCA